MLIKKLVLILAFGLLTFSAFCQNGIKPDSVCVPLGMAVNVLSDLTRYDSLQTQYAILQGKGDDLQRIIDQKDLLLRDCQDSRNRLNLAIGNYQALQAQDKKNVSDLEKKYRGSVRLGRFELVLLSGAIIYGALKSIR